MRRTTRTAWIKDNRSGSCPLSSAASCIARTTGYRKIALWTQSILTPAQKIYRKAGFRLVKEAPHHSFGQDLVGQTWDLDLS